MYENLYLPGAGAIVELDFESAGAGAGFEPGLKVDRLPNLGQRQLLIPILPILVKK